METLSENKRFGGTRAFIVCIQSVSCDMTFAVFLPEEAASPVPFCGICLGYAHENAMVKAGAQARAAEAGIALIFLTPSAVKG